MKVTLISYTKDAMELLIFTKNTRLSMSPEGLDEIKYWSMDRKLSELHYMANTIPSSWEFCDYVFMIEDVTRAFTHQLVRTRTASFAQQTHRVLDMSNYNVTEPATIAANEAASLAWTHYIEQGADLYKHLQNSGIPNEDCRSILPTNVQTNIVMKINLRNFVDLYHKRNGPRVQEEYRQVLQGMKNEVTKVHGWALIFLDRTFDKAAADLDKEIESIADVEKKTRMMKLVDQMRTK